MTELENQLLEVLKECDEAMAYMSEYDIPLTLPDRVKEAIAAAEAAQPAEDGTGERLAAEMALSQQLATRVDDLERQVATAPAVPEAIDLLRTMEWLYKPYDDYSHAQAGYYCPECEEMRESGHRDDCKLLALLAAAPAQVEQRAPGSAGKRAWFRQASEFGPWIECAHDHPDAVLFQEAGATPATGKDSLQVQDEPPVQGSGRGVMFIEFLSAQAAKAGHTELAAELLAAIRAAGETGIQGLPAPTEPACHIAEVSDEEVAIACTPAQRLLLREGMQLYAAPVAGGAIQVRKLGVFGKVYDGPQEKRAYTYADQPHNVAAWRLGCAAANVSAGGDLIDRGLSLLASLQAEGFGVFEMADDSLAAEPEGGNDE